MTQHLLHRPQVRPALEQVRRESVAQGVRRHPLRDPRPAGRLLDDAPRPDAGERRAAGVQEQDPPCPTPVEPRADLARVQCRLAERPAPHRHDALLRSLAEDARQTLLVEHVLHLQRHELRHAAPGRVRELEQRAVADREGLVGVGRCEQALHFSHGEHGRQGAPPLGRLEPLARVPRREPLLDEKLEIGADGRDLPVDRGGREAQVLECVHELAQLSGRERVGPGRAPGRAMRREAPHVAEVARDRVAAVPRLEGEVVPEAFEMEGAIERVGRGVGGHRDSPTASAAPGLGMPGTRP